MDVSDFVDVDWSRLVKVGFISEEECEEVLYYGQCKLDPDGESFMVMIRPDASELAMSVMDKVACMLGAAPRTEVLQ